MLDEARRQANPLGLRVAEMVDFCFAECAMMMRDAVCRLSTRLNRTVTHYENCIKLRLNYMVSK